MTATVAARDGSLDAILEQALTGALSAQLPVVLERLADMGGPRAYSVAQVAERLGVSDSTIYTLIHDGRLRTVPHLSPYRISVKALAEFLAGEAK